MLEKDSHQHNIPSAMWGNEMTRKGDALPDSIGSPLHAFIPMKISYNYASGGDFNSGDDIQTIFFYIKHVCWHYSWPITPENLGRAPVRPRTVKYWPILKGHLVKRRR